MYIPRHFSFPQGAESQLHDLIEAHSFGLLVAGGAADGTPPEGTHLPFVLDRARGALGTLIAHVARANPIWRTFEPGREVLAVFQGPHAYVSPDWYANSGLVPTWNYIAVHGYGVPRLLAGEEQATAALAALSAFMEAGLAPKPPWTLDRIAESARRALVRGIVAFEIELTRLEGKQKLNQNRTAQDRAGVVAALRAHGGAERCALAEAMVERNGKTAASGLASTSDLKS
jgi:transcriptional regulator